MQLQNRKLDILLVVLATGVVALLWRVGWRVPALAVGILAFDEVASNGTLLWRTLAVPVHAVAWLHMRLTRRQQRQRTVYTLGGRDWYARPITRFVQEQLAALVPDELLVHAAQQPLGFIGALTGNTPEQPDAATLRAQWSQSIDLCYKQLQLLLVARAHPDPDDPAAHPDFEWLGVVCPVARAQALVGEILERAQLEDNLPG